MPLQLDQRRKVHLRIGFGVDRHDEMATPLQELVDRRAHRLLDDVDEPLGVDPRLGADEEHTYPGRQMILGTDLITMGTSEKSSLIFIAFGAKGVEPTHLKITKQGDGRYLLEDNQSRMGTLLNGHVIAGATDLTLALFKEISTIAADQGFALRPAVVEPSSSWKCRVSCTIVPPLLNPRTSS